MAVFNEPAQWDHTLGNNADVSTLPDDSAATAGTASLQKLFQLINATPLEAGGIAPDREDVNALFKYLGDQIFYTQNGGIPSYNASYDYIPGRVVLYTDNKLYKCIQANGASSTVVAPDSVSPLGSDYWKDIENQDSTSLIPNQNIVSELPLTDANLHLKDGGLLSGSGAYSAYVDLIAELYNGGTASSSFCTEAEWQTSNTNHGFCNKFVYDSVANTVRLPKVNSEHGALIKSYSSGSDWYRIYQDGWCEQGGHISWFVGTSGTITFQVAFSSAEYSVASAVGNTDASGAFILNILNKTNSSIEWFKTNDALDGDWVAYGYTSISDLQISPIYEYIVIGTVSKTDIQIDIDNVMTDLANKADKDGSNITQLFSTNLTGNLSDSAKIAIVHNAMPSDIYGALTPANDSTYTAPADGYFIAGCGTSSGTLANLSMTINGDVEKASRLGGTGGPSFSIFFPVKKGDVMRLQYSGPATGVYLRFYYAVGSESEQ